MLPPSTAPQAGNRSGFTLLELLVVIVIIGILAGIALPVFNSVQDKARKVQAASDMRNTKVALISYYNDYRNFPLTSAQIATAAAATPKGDLVFGLPSSNSALPNSSADLFDALRAVADNRNNVNNALNPSQNAYWDSGYAKSAIKPRSGITTQDVTLPNGTFIAKGSLVDPWGNCYLVFIDADKDGDLSTIIDQYYTDAGTVKPGSGPLGFAIASMGKDGTLGTKGNGKLANADDIVSWQ